MEWSVMVEVWVDEEVDLALPAYQALLDKLTDVHGTLGGHRQRWDSRVTVEAADGVEAVAKAVQAIRERAEAAGVPFGAVARLDVVEADELAEELSKPNFPDLVDTRMAADIVGITRQRLHQLRQSGRFPRPLLELPSTPLWARAGVEAFAAQERKPGRPPKVDRGMSDELANMLGTGSETTPPGDA
jgi:hypothetical protein